MSMEKAIEKYGNAVEKFITEVESSWMKFENGSPIPPITSELDIRKAAIRAAKEAGLADANGDIPETLLERIVASWPPE